MNGSPESLLTTVADTSRLAAATLLAVAAGLKWLTPDYTDAAFFAVTDGPLHSTLLVAEFLLAVALVLRLFGGIEVALGLLAFATFSGLNLWSGLSRANTCGCFGSLKINPWYMFAVDIAIAAGLLAHLLLEKPTLHFRWRRIASVAALLGLGMIGVQFLDLHQKIRSRFGGEMVYLEPQTIDLGEHKGGATVEVSARLRNRSGHAVRVIGFEQTGYATAGTGFLQVVEPGAVADLPLTFLIRGRPGRRLADSVIYCEIDSRVVPLRLTSTWVVVGE